MLFGSKLLLNFFWFKIETTAVAETVAFQFQFSLVKKKKSTLLLVIRRRWKTFKLNYFLRLRLSCNQLKEKKEKKKKLLYVLGSVCRETKNKASRQGIKNKMCPLVSSSSSSSSSS